LVSVSRHWATLASLPRNRDRSKGFGDRERVDMAILAAPAACGGGSEERLARMIAESIAHLHMSECDAIFSWPAWLAID
jgi:hypothetical protein